MTPLRWPSSKTTASPSPTQQRASMTARGLTLSWRRQPSQRSLWTAAIASGCLPRSPLAKSFGGGFVNSGCILSLIRVPVVSGRIAGGFWGTPATTGDQANSLLSRPPVAAPSDRADGWPGAPSDDLRVSFCSSRQGGEVRGRQAIRDSSHSSQASARSFSISVNFTTSLCQCTKQARSNTLSASWRQRPKRPRAATCVRPLRLPMVTCRYLPRSLGLRFQKVSVGTW
mmetsp:Transcript_34383/g.102133  ORF Transcript_34383/g.102133 Transcript_34383/m.102133 type:complete len:228 (-) Transcript_34383:244-927(-)